MVFPEKNLIEDIVRKNKSNFCKIISTNYVEFYKWVTEQIDSSNKSETLYKWLYGIVGKCKTCGNGTQFVSIHLGYREFCSNKCVNESELVRDRTKDAFINKYGVDNVSKNESIKLKKKNTFLERYNTDCPFGIGDTREKAREGLIRKYGTDKIFTVKEIRSKIQKTKLDNFYDECISGERLTNVDLKVNRKNFSGIDTDGLLFKCKSCNHEFTSYMKYGNDPVCPMCHISTFHREVVDYIRNINESLKMEINSLGVIENRELDIYIKELGIAIECNGNYWHSELSGKKMSYYHVQKTTLCEKLGIQLIHIFEDEWVNKSDIVKQKLKNLLRCSKESIYARKCNVKEISHVESKSFLNNNHIQGSDKSKIILGLFYENKLVAVMTFCGLRKSLGYESESDVYELCRYATAEIRINGGAGKLLSYFIKHYNPKKVITYADRRWTSFNINMYDRLGFVRGKVTKCNYWYLRGIKRLHRFNFAKHTLNTKLKNFDPNISEWENMKNNGWDRIWDCGSIRYELTL